MTARLTPDVQAARARVLAADRGTRALRRATEEGGVAFLVGEPATACPLRHPARRNAWLRGWRDAEQQAREAEARRALTPAERARGRAALAALRQAVAFLHDPSPA